MLVVRYLIVTDTKTGIFFYPELTVGVGLPVRGGGFEFLSILRFRVQERNQLRFYSLSMGHLRVVHFQGRERGSLLSMRL